LRTLRNRRKNLNNEFTLGSKVIVRSFGEILDTLDENGTYERLPFMPEMKKYCGGCYTILKNVENVLIEGLGYRRIKDTVILEGVTCDGSAHGGCQRTCHILWKKAWLKKLDNEKFEDPVLSLNMESDNSVARKKVHLCQLINLRIASSSPRSLDGLAQYLSEKKPGRVGRLILKPLNFCLWLWNLILKWCRRSAPGAEALRGSLKRTPAICLNLKPGEYVEVKTKEEIVFTLDKKGRNRGLAFTPEMLKYCGKRYRVLKRIDRMIDQNTGRMRKISNTVLLENVLCDGGFHKNCPLNCYCLWREAWLKRVE